MSMLESDPLGPFWAGDITFVVGFCVWNIFWEVLPGLAALSCLFYVGFMGFVRGTWLRAGVAFGLMFAALLTLLVRIIEHVHDKYS